MQLSRCGDDEGNWSLAHNTFHAAAGSGIGILHGGLMHDAPLANERAQQHGKCAVFVDLKLICFLDKQDGVGKRPIVIHQRQRAAARQAIYGFGWKQSQRCFVV